MCGFDCVWGEGVCVCVCVVREQGCVETQIFFTLTHTNSLSLPTHTLAPPPTTHTHSQRLLHVYFIRLGHCCFFIRF